LVARAFFDTLTGQARFALGTAGLLGVLAALAVGQAALWLIAGFVEITMRFTMSGLVRRNLLRLVLAKQAVRRHYQRDPPALQVQHHSRIEAALQRMLHVDDVRAHLVQETAIDHQVGQRFAARSVGARGHHLQAGGKSGRLP